MFLAAQKDKKTKRVFDIDLILVDHCQVFFSDQFIDLLPETIFHPASRDNTFRARPWLKENLVNSFKVRKQPGGRARVQT